MATVLKDWYGGAGWYGRATGSDDHDARGRQGTTMLKDTWARRAQAMRHHRPPPRGRLDGNSVEQRVTRRGSRSRGRGSMVRSAWLPGSECWDRQAEIIRNSISSTYQRQQGLF